MFKKKEDLYSNTNVSKPSYLKSDILKLVRVSGAWKDNEGMLKSVC